MTLLAAGAIVGCGGNGDSGTAGADLAAPVEAKCAPRGFKPSEPTRHVDQGHPSGWQLYYRAKFTNPTKQPGATTNIVLVEESPKLPARGVRGGHPETVGNQDISLRTLTEPLPSHVAQWKTAKARYLAISNGASTAKLEELIACLP